MEAQIFKNQDLSEFIILIRILLTDFLQKSHLLKYLNHGESIFDDLLRVEIEGLEAVQNRHFFSWLPIFFE